MSGGLAAGVLVSALLRRVFDDGGHAAVLARGDADSGMILILLREKGRHHKTMERAPGYGAPPGFVAVGPQISENEQELTDYWQRRRRQDPDLWVIELDSPNGERFAAETILSA